VDVFFECKTGDKCRYGEKYPHDEHGRAIFCRECQQEGFQTCVACDQ
jgi:hypothetical protein